MSADSARPVVHWEIVARDTELLGDFHRALFSWQIGDGPVRMVNPGLGGLEPGPSGHLRQGEEGGVNLWVQVRDLRSCLLWRWSWEERS